MTAEPLTLEVRVYTREFDSPLTRAYWDPLRLALRDALDVYGDMANRDKGDRTRWAFIRDGGMVGWLVVLLSTPVLGMCEAWRPSLYRLLTPRPPEDL